MATMQKRLIFEGAVLLLACAGIFAALASWDLTPTDITADLSRDLESKLGDRMIVELRRQGRTIRTEPLDRAVDTTLSRLTAARATTRFGYTCEVLEAPQINALMLPGGRIVVFRGLLDVIEQPEELAAVLAHEIGHAEKQHVAKRLFRQFGLVVLGGAAGGDGVLITEITKGLVASVFDRAQEEEADRFGRDLLLSAKLDPRVMATALRHMKQGVQKLPRALQLLSTHPDIDDRIRESLSHRVPSGAKFTPLGIDWPAVQKSLPERPAADPDAND